jgi:DNA-binding transcriptional LysR family regulator
VRCGIGLAVLPCYLADSDPSLVRVMDPESFPARQVWVVIHRDLQHAPRIRACADFLIAAIGARAELLAGETPAPTSARRAGRKR